MKTQAYLVLIYGILLFIGGIIGFAKAQSYPSLFMGGGSAILIILCSVWMFRGSVAASYSAAGLTTALTLFFCYRFWLTLKVMPAGVMAIASIVVFIVLLKKVLSEAKALSKA